MSELLTKAAKIQADWKREEADSQQKCLIEIAAREVNFASLETDAVDLLTILEDSGRTLEDYKELVDTIHRIRELKSTMVEQPVGDQRYHNAVRRYEERVAVARIKAATRLWQQANSAEESTRENAYELSKLEKAYPELFEAGEPITVIGPIPMQPAPQPVKQKKCALCEGEYPASTDGPFCGFKCKQEVESFRPELEKLLGRKLPKTV